MLPLSGLGVLVTRPETQAMPLCRQLQALGASASRLPAIEIQARGARAELRTLAAALPQYDLIIFVSANAVRFGAELLEQRRELTLAAVGPATVRALNQAGYRVAILPAGEFDSEGLLAHPRLQSLAGQRVLLIKGEGGRELLESELKARGAALSVQCVYARRRAQLSAARAGELAGQFAAGALQVITATSVEIGESLLAMGASHPVLLPFLQQCHWLVPSERIARALEAAGLRAPLVMAASAEDQSLVEALLRWRSSASGA